MKKSSYISKLLAVMSAIMTLTLTVTSCDSMIYDDEGDCSAVYRLTFRYDYNMKYADAFAHEVKSVEVYAYDSNGSLVWKGADKGTHLAAEGYAMDLPLEAGDYHIVAWCGLDNGESFTVSMPARSALQDLACRLNTKTDAGGRAYSDEDLHHLYYGSLDVTLPPLEDGGTYTCTVPLIKDTNVFRIVLQQMSGQGLDSDDFAFTIEDENAWLAGDNSLMPGGGVRYEAWNQHSGEAGVVTGGDGGAGTVTGVSAVVAEITTGRLVMRDWNTYSRPMLTVRSTDDGHVVLSVPVIDYALLVKGHYNRNMSSQEYLDRQDEYNMTFFIDQNHRWLSASVIINSWRIVLDNVDM